MNNVIVSKGGIIPKRFSTALCILHVKNTKINRVHVYSETPPFSSTASTVTAQITQIMTYYVLSPAIIFHILNIV